jgi:undecaprenyl phosphate-alpha-L-ara4N flippase subunit ArnE
MQERTRLWAIGLILLTTIFTSAAQVFYKTASARLPEIVTNWPLLAGMVCYGIGAVLMILSFKGGEVSVLTPFLATSYLWVTLASYLVFGEEIGMLKIVGVCVIMLGISIIGYASRNSEVLEYPEVP